MSEFGRLAAALNDAEATAWDRVGGSTEADGAAICALEARVHDKRPETADDWRWAAQRLARAAVNGWCDEAFAPLVRLVGDPMTVGSAAVAMPPRQG